MPALPSHCRKCGAMFQNNAIVIEDSVNVTTSGNVTTCPNCGADAHLMEGTFDVKDGKIYLDRGSEITQDLLIKFDLLTKKAIHENIPLPEYALAATKLHSTFGFLVSEAAKAVRKHKKAVATTVTTGALILAVISQCSVNLNADIKLDVNQLVNQLNQRAIEDGREDSKDGSSTGKPG